MSIFENIIDTKSFLVIEMIATSALASANEKEKETLEKIIRSNDLDECWMLAHEYLGNKEKAQELKNWIEIKSRAISRLMRALPPQ